MSPSFRERFLLAESSFMHAVTHSGHELEAFDTQWTDLLADFERAMDLGAVDDSLLQLATSIISKVAIIGEGLVDMQEKADEMSSSFLSSVENALAQLSLDDKPSATSDSRRKSASSRKSAPTLPPFISVAFIWMLSNLHDPYPSSSLKRSWAQEAGIAPRTMDDWCKAIRKEIGWVSLTKSHFNGSRSLAVAAAGSVFLDLNNGPPVPFEVQADFLAVKAKLENLYIVERGLAAGPATPHEQPTKRAEFTVPETTAPVLTSFMLPIDNVDELPNDTVPTAPTSPYTQCSTRVPSLVFDASDSEAEERIPELSLQSLLDDASIRIASYKKSTPDRRLKRTRHCYIERRREHSRKSWSPDILIQPIYPETFTPPPLTTEIDCRTLPQTGAVVSQTLSNNHPKTNEPSLRSKKRRSPDADEQPAAKKSRITPSLSKRGVHRPQAASACLPTATAEALIEPPNDFVQIDRLLRELEQDLRTQPEASLSGDDLVTSMPVECNLFNFATDEAQPTSGVIPLCTVDMPITAVDNDINNWEQLLALVPSEENDDTAALQDRQFDEFLAAFTNSSALAGLDNGTSTSGDGTALSVIQVNDIQDALDLAPAAASSPVIASSPPSSEGDSIWEDLFGSEDFLSSFVTEDLQLATLDQPLGDTSDTLGPPSAPDALGEIASALPTALV